MGLKELFQPTESLVAIDIGSTAIKAVELDLTGSKPALIQCAVAPVSGDIFSNYSVSKLEKAGELIAALLTANDIVDRRVVTAIPGPSVFTKKIKMPRMKPSELKTNIQLEAGNFIPHNIDAVRLDFQVLGYDGKGQMDVMVVAVKNEVIDSFTGALGSAGLEAAVADVDYFALQNIFEHAYPEDIAKTVGLINIGARYSSINICRGGTSLFTGDISVGGKATTEALVSGMGIAADQAEQLKRKKPGDSSDDFILSGLLEQQVTSLATEFNRQLSFFWNASGADGGIDKILITGGGSLLPGLEAAIADKTGIECAALNPFRGVECGSVIDAKFIKESSPLVAIATGLALRQAGDKLTPEAEGE